MHPALRKRPLFTKNIPIFHFFHNPPNFISCLRACTAIILVVQRQQSIVYASDNNLEWSNLWSKHFTDEEKYGLLYRSPNSQIMFVI